MGEITELPIRARTEPEKNPATLKQASVLSFNCVSRNSMVDSFEAGRALEDAGKIRAALLVYNRNLAGSSPSAKAAIHAGTIQFKRGKFFIASRYYEEALAIDHKNPLAHFDLAVCCEYLGQNDRAIQHYKEAIRFEADYADAHFNLGLIYKNLCMSSPERPHKGEAMHHFKLYKRFGDNSDLNRLAKEHFKELKEENNMTLVRSMPVADRADYEDIEDEADYASWHRNFRGMQKKLD